MTAQKSQSAANTSAVVAAPRSHVVQSLCGSSQAESDPKEKCIGLGSDRLRLAVPGNGAPGRIRTCDARFRKPTLYPLSYGGLKIGNVLVRGYFCGL